MNDSRTSQTSISRRGILRAAVAAASMLAIGCSSDRERDATQPQPVASGNRVHRILTCNILFDLPEQKGTPFDWAAGRRDTCIQLIRDQHPDLVCMQEVGRGQNADFIHAFPDFGAFGYDDPYVDRRPVRFQNIKNVILYSRARYEVVNAGQYWLSATPLVPGSRLGAELPRHVTWLRLRDRSTDTQFRILDTHWGLKKPIRLQEAPIIAADTEPYADDFPQLLCGDFNSDSASEEQAVLHRAGWKDTYDQIHSSVKPTTSSTSHPSSKPAPAHRIDYIYYRGPVCPVAARIFRSPDPAHPASDHPFVLADVEI